VELGEETDDLTTTTSTSAALTGTWALGPDTLKGLPPDPNDTASEPRTPYALLRLDAGGTFDLSFGAGCILQGISGTWTPTASGARLAMQPDDWQTWTDGLSEPLRPTTLDAAIDGGHLRVTGVDEKGRAIDQRWRPYAR
jgi:hypothetical protein